MLLLLPLLFAAKLFVCTITGLFRFRSQFPSFFCRRFDHHHHHRPIGVCLCLPPLHHYLLGAVQCTLSCSCFFLLLFSATKSMLSVRLLGPGSFLSLLPLPSMPLPPLPPIFAGCRRPQSLVCGGIGGSVVEYVLSYLW